MSYTLCECGKMCREYGPLCDDCQLSAPTSTTPLGTACNSSDLTPEVIKELARLAEEGKGFPKRKRRGPQHGNSPAAIGFRALQSRGIIGRHKPFPVGGMTHCTAKRHALAAAITQAISISAGGAL